MRRRELLTKDHCYRVLGVPPDASRQEIKRAYRRRVKHCHPDLSPGNARAEAELKEILRAYRALVTNRAVDPAEMIEQAFHATRMSSREDEPDIPLTSSPFPVGQAVMLVAGLLVGTWLVFKMAFTLGNWDTGLPWPTGLEPDSSQIALLVIFLVAQIGGAGAASALGWYSRKRIFALRSAAAGAVFGALAAATEMHMGEEFLLPGGRVWMAAPVLGIVLGAAGGAIGGAIVAYLRQEELLFSHSGARSMLANRAASAGIACLNLLVVWSAVVGVLVLAAAVLGLVAVTVRFILA